MPFLKWIGGKNKSIDIIKEYIPNIYNCRGYIEPFLGSGSLFFHIKENNYLEGKPIYLSDINPYLINTYQIVRDKLPDLLKLLRIHEIYNTEKYYIEMRNKLNGLPRGMSNIETAAAFIYLNNSSFRGWQTDKLRKMVAPYNRNPNKKIIDKDLKTYTHYLQGTFLNAWSFEMSTKIKDVKDYFVYLDPPYYGDNSIHYWGEFHISNKMMLYHVFKDLDERGAKVMMSNYNKNIVYQTFKDYYIYQIAINNKYNITNNKESTEVIVTNYEHIQKQKSIEDAWIN